MTRVMTGLPDRKTRHALGSARRKAVPRRTLAEFRRAPSVDPLAILALQDAARIPALVGERHRRMRVSPFAFLRGAAAVMAADLAGAPASGIETTLCGDAHLGNFGTFATPELRPIFDLNDFDESCPGPFEWDVKRLSASLVVCGLDAGLARNEAGALARLAARSYRRHMARLALLSPLAAWQSSLDVASIVAAIEPAPARRHAEKCLAAAMARHDDHWGIVAKTPRGPRLRNLPEVPRLPREEAVVEAIFSAYPETITAPLRALLARFRMVDQAFKVVGVGSVGTFCAIGLFASGDGDPLLLQVKEAGRSVLDRGRDALTGGERVVQGQRTLQAQSDIFLGWTPHPIAGRSFYVRRLKDSRMAEVAARFEAEALPFTATICGQALARGHARSADPAEIAGYCGEGHAFDEAIEAFAIAYAAQTHSDWQAFVAPVDEPAVAA